MRRSQTLGAIEVAIVGDTAVLTTMATDAVVEADGEDARFRMPVTQVWVREHGTGRCLAGHAGPHTG